MWFKDDFVWGAENDKRMFFSILKYAMEASHYVLPNDALFRFLERSGAKICVHHQMSFSSIFEGWEKSDSWVTLSKSLRKAVFEI